MFDFKIMIRHCRGYIRGTDFLKAMGPEGFGIYMTDRQQQLLLEECQDSTGAVEPSAFTRFIAVSAGVRGYRAILNAYVSSASL